MIRLPATSLSALLLCALSACGSTGEDAPRAEEAPAPAPPDSEIYLAALSRASDGLRVTGVRNVTSRIGYDNQPAFLPDSSGFYFTSIGDDGQADVFRYDIEAAAATRITRTPESEYSPTPLPDGSGFSSVRVERDGTQRLWRFDLAGTSAETLIPTIAAIGYHAWVDPDNVALFIVGSDGEPHVLKVANLTSGRATTAAQHVGRSLHKIPGQRAISFVDQSTEPRRIGRYAVDSSQTSSLITAPEGSEDYVWTSDGSILMAQGTQLMRWDGSPENGWKPVADLSANVGGPITRLAVSPDQRYLALVALAPSEPVAGDE